MISVDWNELRNSSLGSQRLQLFRIFQDASSEVQESDVEANLALLQLVPRLAELLQNSPDLSDYWEPFSSLARAVGLWNYIPEASADVRERILAESMSPGPVLDNLTLHKLQARALQTLLRGENLVLSAPTSFGKSLLVDAAIASGAYDRIAIVVPTIALMDETRRRISARFGKRFDVAIHHSEVSEAERVIFIGPQERLINRPDIGKLDLLVVDEFYKLDPNRRDRRSSALNAAVYKLLKRSTQFFFLGPNIEDVPNRRADDWQFQFLPTRFATVAVDTIDLSIARSKSEALKDHIFRSENWPAIVFASSPDRANEISGWLSRSHACGNGAEMAEWLAVHYGSRWDIPRAVRNGIAVHHGRIPRAVAAHFIRMFNSRFLPVMICTSTLIEGVNTAAKSVFVYDKSIENRRFDFFTFSNIRGRAGRLGEHHVGRVFLFSEPPVQDHFIVDAPVFDDYDNVGDDFAIHVDDDDLPKETHERVEEIARSLGLTREELRRFASIGVSELSRLKKAVAQELRREHSRLVWSGWPDWYNLLACCNVICSVRQARAFGTRSPKQLALYLHRLRIAKTLRDFHLQYDEQYKGAAEDYDKIFKFLRACEYSLPEYFSAIELFLLKAGRKPNYASALHGLPRWWCPDAAKNLEERGIPIQISERFYVDGDDVRRLNWRLVRAARSFDEKLTAFERDWILEAQ